ncbi:MAG: TRAP transporter large permease [Firmicutes bacterium]|nr:TRAP transporter large permease [Bacillota bacterium]
MTTPVIIAAVVLVAVSAAGLIFFKRAPLGLVLTIASAAAALASGFGLPLRHLVEGMFTYLNIVLICATGVVFLKSMEMSGAAASMTRSLVRSLHRVPWLFITVIMLLLLVPGALTGVAVNSVLSIGVLVAPILIGMGVPRVTTAVIIGLGAILSMSVPPTTLLAMNIAMGINAPFEGFTVPTLVLSVPLAVITGLVLAMPHVKKTSLDELLSCVPSEYEEMPPAKAWLPLGTVVLIMVLIRAFPRVVPDIGTPLTFVIGALVSYAVSGRKLNLFNTAAEALSGPMLGVLELLVGVGVFVQITSLTGVRGLLVVSSLSLPSLLAFIAAAVSLILSGGILSPFGAASIFVVPFALFFLGKNQIVTISALSLLAALSQFTPPTAIAGRFAAQICGVEDYSKVLKAAVLPICLLALVAIAFIVWADPIARVLL